MPTDVHSGHESNMTSSVTMASTVRNLGRYARRMENQTVDTLDTHDTDDAIEVTDELLVEEISIDGMCGVY